MKQHIVRFNSSTPIEFEGMEGGAWTPNINKEYSFGVEKTGDNVVLFDENRFAESGFDRSEPIPKDQIQIVGNIEVVKMSHYSKGFAVMTTDHARHFLQSEIDSHDNMDGEAASMYVCDLNAAQGSLAQMDDGIFAEIMDLSDGDDVSGIRKQVSAELERLSELLGGSSLLRDILA